MSDYLGALQREVMAQAAQAVTNALSDGTGFVSVVFLDLVGLGLTNRRLGWPAGDSLVKAASGLLDQVTSTSERVWHIGADEYLLLIPGRSNRSARRRVATFQRRIAEEPIGLGAERILVSFRAGGATASRPECTTWDLYVAAGEALRCAKTHNWATAWNHVSHSRLDDKAHQDAVLQGAQPSRSIVDSRWM